jgi:RNA polymerase sigma-32 factor
VSFEDTLTDDNPLADETISEGELEVYLSVFLGDLLTKLDPRERNVVDRRFTDNPETLEEIANSFGLSRERVRQIEERCLNKIRDAMAKGGHLGVPGTWRIGLDDWPVVMDKMTLVGE